MSPWKGRRPPLIALLTRAVVALERIASLMPYEDFGDEAMSCQFCGAEGSDPCTACRAREWGSAPSPKARRRRPSEDVLVAVARAAGPVTREQLAAALPEMPWKTLSACLSSLNGQKKIRPAKVGEAWTGWELAPHPAEASP